MATPSTNSLKPVDAKGPYKVKSMLVLFCISGVAIFLLLMSMYKTSVNMITHAQDRPIAVAEFIKACAAEAQSKGLKNGDAIKFSDVCVKAKAEAMDSAAKK